jgi:hypothetical protein
MLYYNKIKQFFLLKLSKMTSLEAHLKLFTAHRLRNTGLEYNPMAHTIEVFVSKYF